MTQPDPSKIKLETYQGKLGLSVENLHALYTQLCDDFEVATFGFQQLREIEDLRLRAVVSDQLVQAGYAAIENLAECKLHLNSLDEILRSDIVRRPMHDYTADDAIQDARVRMELTGYFRAAFSSLDCIAAVIIGITRAPLSISRASYTQLRSLTDLNAASDTQSNAWTEIVGIVDRHANQPPAGWWTWLAGMRNANVHRARQITIFLPDGPPPKVSKLELPPSAREAVKELFDFAMHLGGRPATPDMQNLSMPGEFSELYISEHAQSTLQGVFHCINELMEELAATALGQWRACEGLIADFPVPEVKWTLGPDSEKFDGVNASELTHKLSGLMTNPTDSKRLQVAENLRHLSA